MRCSIGFLYVSLFSALLMKVDAVCPDEDSDQKVSCRPGMAVSNLQWSKDSSGCKKFSIDCKNATDSCKEECNWNHECKSDDQSSDKIHYVRGVHAKYDPVWEEQQLEFLCCWAKRNRTVPSCPGPWKELDGKQRGNGEKVMKQVVQKSGAKGDFSLSVEWCIGNNNTTVCPLAQMDSKLGAPAGLAGLAGLAALSGLALVKKRQLVTKSPPCCCLGATNYKCTQGCTVCPECNTLGTCGDVLTCTGVCSGSASAESTSCKYYDGGYAPLITSPGYWCDWGPAV